MADKKKKRRPRYEWTLIVKDKAGEYPFVVVAPDANVAVSKAEDAFGMPVFVRVVKASEVFWEA